MRSVLLISLLLLAAVVAQSLRTQAPAVSGEEAPAVAVDLRLFSTGLGLPPAMQVKRTGMTAIWAGPWMREVEPNADGMYVGVFGAQGNVLGSEHFDLCGDPDAVERLAEYCEAAPLGSVLALVVHGSIRVRRAGPLDGLFARLGAESRPQREDSASWAFVARRVAGGFMPVGEAFSRTAGVMLSLPFGPARDAVVRLIDEEPAGVVALLAGAPKGPAVLRGFNSANGAVDAAVLSFGGARRSWKAPSIKLGEGARFRALVAMIAPEAGEGARAVVELRAEGALVAREELEPRGEQRRLREWAVDLDELVGREVALEIVVVREKLGEGARVFIGAPVVSWEE